MRHAFRLDDVSSGLTLRFVREVSLELLPVRWQRPGEGEKIIQFRSFLSHFHKVASKEVLAREGEHSWEVVDLLVVFHLHEDFRGDVPVGPPHVPLGIVAISLDLPLQFLAHLGHDLVFAV